MSKTKQNPNILLVDRVNNLSMEGDLMRSTWQSLSKGKILMQQELQDVFAFDFSDIISHMNWDNTTQRQ